MLGALAFALILAVVALLAYMGRYSGRIVVERSRLIAAPIDAVYAEACDLGQWLQWFPWQGDRDGLEAASSPATVVGSRWHWNTARLGSGMVQHVSVRPPECIDQRVTSKLPFAYQGRLRWTFEGRDGNTLVHMRLRARVPFSLRFVAPTVRGALELDYRLALDQLAARLESGDMPRYSIEPMGQCSTMAQTLAVQRYDGPIDGVAAARESCLTNLRLQLQALGVPATGPPLVQYLSTNTKQRRTVCLVGLPIATPAAPELATKNLPAQKTFAVRLRGSHSTLDLAWYLAMRSLMANDFQADQRLPPFERYESDDEATGLRGPVTELHIPIKV
jgi:predicted transcriptional regulator YdeE